jgi:putative selenate reductase molybdopterin-binding subunit
VEEGFRESDYVIEREFRTQRQQQHCRWSRTSPSPGSIRRFAAGDPHQHAGAVPRRRQVAMILQIPVSRVHVIKPRIGGGFGGKQEMLLEDICGALALATRRPVKIEYTREEEFYMARSRHPQILRMKMGVRRDGTVLASQMTVLATTGAYGSHSTTVQGNTGSKVLPLYRTPHMRFECHVVYTNAPVAGAFRGYGCPQGFFAQESVVDEIAAHLGIDPLEFRART